MKKRIFTYLSASVFAMSFIAIPSTNLVANTVLQQESHSSLNEQAKTEFLNAWTENKIKLENKAVQGKINSENAKAELHIIHDNMNRAYDILKRQFIGDENYMNLMMDNLSQRGELSSKFYKATLKSEVSLQEIENIVNDFIALL